jgi:hypothetical protein
MCSGQQSFSLDKIITERLLLLQKKERVQKDFRIPDVFLYFSLAFRLSSLLNIPLECCYSCWVHVLTP